MKKFQYLLFPFFIPPFPNYPFFSFMITQKFSIINVHIDKGFVFKIVKYRENTQFKVVLYKKLFEMHYEGTALSKSAFD